MVQKTSQIQKNVPSGLFNFSESDLTTLGYNVKGHKFFYRGVELIYPKDSVEKVGFMIDCIRLIQNLRNKNLYGKKDDLVKQLDKIVEDFKDLYKESVSLMAKLQMDVGYNKHRIIKKFDFIVLENSMKINALIDFVFPLGMQVKKSDPDETQAYY